MILDTQIRTLAQEERRILHELLPKIQRMDATKGYLDLGYSSLFDYLTRGVGYSEGAAQRRIDAARLIPDVPNLTEKIQSGALNLSHVSIVKRATRQTAKLRKVTATEKVAIMQKLENKTRKEAEQITATFFDLPTLESEITKTQKDGSQRLELTLTATDSQLLARVQSQCSHKVRTGKIYDLFIHLLKEEDARNAKPATPSTATKAVTPKLRREMLDDRCAECDSTWQLELDHVHPQALGGTHEKSNYQTLCGKHNRAKGARLP